MMTSPTPHMTIRETAAWLGITEPHLYMKTWRRLRAIERTKDVQLITRCGRSIFVTEASLRDHCPELFSRRDSAVQAARAELAALEAKIAETKKYAKGIGARVRDTEASVEVLTEAVAKVVADFRAAAHAQLNGEGKR